VVTSVLRGREADWQALSEAFRSGTYDAIHYAGHAYFDRGDPSKSGAICSDHRVLSGADLAGMNHLPALVFFNACEAARIRKQPERAGGRSARNRIEQNVSLAEAFLRGGIANYVGTYWPVGDAGAKTFAEVFYAELLKGEAIGDALLKGRRAVFELGNVDWADYIHYGGFDFRLEHVDPE
jgi:CHAT domain-containing protein